MDEVRWGMIGCGDVAERKSGPAFNQINHSRLVAVTGRNFDNAQDYARRHGVPKCHRDAEQLINDPDINAIYIATPPDAHAGYTLQAAQAGKPVYVEKPMARTYAECQSMIAACAQAGVPLYVAYYRRCLPAFLKIKELVEGGKIGPVRGVSVHLFYPPRPQDFDRERPHWRIQREISGGGYLYDLASHQLDYLDFLFGPLESVVSRAANQAGLYVPEDIVSAAWSHPSGVIGSGMWCFSAGQAVDQAEIIGSRGRITFAFFDQSPIRLELEGGGEEFFFPRHDPIQLPLIQLIVDELRGAGTCPSTGVSAARTNRVMEQMVQSNQE